jgi:hypothetical protein
MDYIIGAEIIKDTLNSIPMYSKIKTVKIKKSLPDFVLFRIKFENKIFNQNKIWFLIFDTGKILFFKKLNSEISLLDKTFSRIKNSSVDHILYRGKNKNSVFTIFKNRFLINQIINLKILNRRIDEYVIYDKIRSNTKSNDKSQMFYRENFFTNVSNRTYETMRITDKFNYYMD